jgi:hypothetical protein
LRLRGVSSLHHATLHLTQQLVYRLLTLGKCEVATENKVTIQTIRDHPKPEH